MHSCNILFGLSLTMASAVETATESKQSEARAEAHAQAHGNETQSMKQSVTVTSDGNRTIRTTTTERNGVRDVKREILDAQGRVIEGGAEEQEPQDEKTGPQEGQENQPWIGIKVKVADTPSLNRAMQGKQAGDQVSVGIMRKGQKSSIDLTLEARPARNNTAGPQKNDESGTSGRSSSGTAALELENGESFDKVLTDPHVPERFKKSVREMQERMREFQEKHAPR